MSASEALPSCYLAGMEAGPQTGLQREIARIGSAGSVPDIYEAAWISCSTWHDRLRRAGSNRLVEARGCLDAGG
jgi:hypothetical protein